MLFCANFVVQGNTRRKMVLSLKVDTKLNLRGFKMEKITKLGSVAMAFFLVTILVFSFSSIAKASITVGEECNQEFEYTTSHDADYSQVNIDYQDSDQAITVHAKTGYQLVSVKLDVDGDNHAGYWTYSVVDGVKFNPNPGQDINCAIVRVKKVCEPTPTPSISATPTPEVTPTAVVTPTPTPTVTPQILGTSTASPAATTDLPSTGGSDASFYWILIVAVAGLTFYLKKVGWARLK
jgi:hypothetical protein